MGSSSASTAVRHRGHLSHSKSESVPNWSVRKVILRDLYVELARHLGSDDSVDPFVASLFLRGDALKLRLSSGLVHLAEVDALAVAWHRELQRDVGIAKLEGETGA